MKPLDLSPSSAALVAGFARFEPGPRSAAAIMQAFVNRTGVSEKDLKGPDRCIAVSHPRQELMALLIDAGKSTTWIGKFLGGRHHTTIMHGAKVHRARVAMQEAA